MTNLLSSYIVLAAYLLAALAYIFIVYKAVAWFDRWTAARDIRLDITEIIVGATLMITPFFLLIWHLEGHSPIGKSILIPLGALGFTIIATELHSEWRKHRS